MPPRRPPTPRHCRPSDAGPGPSESLKLCVGQCFCPHGHRAVFVGQARRHKYPPRPAGNARTTRPEPSPPPLIGYFDPFTTGVDRETLRKLGAVLQRAARRKCWEKEGLRR